MAGISSELRRRCRSVLLRCSEFDSNASLTATFVTSELSPFYSGLPQAESKSMRVDMLMAYLLNIRLKDGRAVLPVFVSTLADHYAQGDAIRQDLSLLAQELSGAFDTLEAQLSLLNRLYKSGQISEEGYRTELLALGVNPSTIFLPEPVLADLHRRLNLLDDVQIQAFTLDYFPQVYDRFGYGVAKEERISLLLEHCRHYPEAVPVLERVLQSLPQTGDPADALDCYLSHVIEENSRLQLQGIRSAFGLVSIDLEEVYVTLTTTVRKTVTEETWVEEMTKFTTGETKRCGTKQPRETIQQVKVQVQEALAMHPRLVVLGDPGCGKTTLLRYLALTYARDLTDYALRATKDGRYGASNVNWMQQRLGLDEHRLPILLPLRDFARYLEREYSDVGADRPTLLLDYLRLYFTNQNLVLPPDFFEARLKAGECVVFFDGVDEVASMTLRQRAARILEKFTLAYPQNRYVVTSRIVGYTGGARLSADYAVTTMRDFTDADIERFARHWNRAVEVVLAGGVTDYALRKAEVEADKLIQAIQGKDRVRELAVNPLLLTVIALVQRYRAQLPDRRVELYEEAIEVLLVQWDAVKRLPSTAVLQGLELDAGDRRSLLEPVALWLMEQHAREIELNDLRGQLAQPFQAMLKDAHLANKAINGFIALISARSGLLTERGQGIYAFSHMAFQEHLAARAIADRENYIEYTLPLLKDSWWREVISLEVSYLSTQGKRRASELIRAILTYEGILEDERLRIISEILREVGFARIESALLQEIQERQSFTPIHFFLQKVGCAIQYLGTSEFLFIPQDKEHYLYAYGSIYTRLIQGDPPTGDDFSLVCRGAKNHYGANLKHRIAFVISDQRPEPGARYRLYEIRERDGLVIVPLDINSFAQASPDRSVDDLLRSEIDQATGDQDLYTVPGPVSDDLSFFGRERVLQDIVDLLDGGYPVGLFGLRKVGKTSLIQRLYGRLVLQRPIAMVDIQKTTQQQGIWSLYPDIIAAFANHLQRYRPEVTLPNLQLWPGAKSPSPAMADAFIQDVQDLHMMLGAPDKDKRLLLIVDEVDRLLPAGASPGYSGFTAFFGQLRATNQQAQMLDFLVVGVDAAVNRVERWQDHDNELYRALHEVWMPPMGHDDVGEMIESLGFQMGVRYEEAALRWLANCGGGQPFVTRQMCGRAVAERLGRGAITVTLEQARMAVEEFIFDDPYLPELWRTRLDEAQREMLRTLARATEPLPRLTLLPSAQRQAAVASLVALEDYTLIRREAGHYTIAWDVFRQWIRWVELGLEA